MTTQFDFWYPADIATAAGRLQLEIGDRREEPHGVRPYGRNFTVAELHAMYTAEGGDPAAAPDDKAVALATARLFDILAREYANQPTATRLGPHSVQISATAFYSREAKALRDKWAGPNRRGRRRAGSASVSPEVTVKNVSITET